MAADQTHKSYLDPQTIAQIRDFNLRAKLIVSGFLQGLHRGPKQAFSLEYDQHREYYPGDALKLVDWKLYGKTDRFYIKQYQEETNLRAWLVMDISKSMSYRGDKVHVTKLRYATYLAAALAYLLLEQRDLVGMITFDKKIQKFIRPSSSKKQLNLILAELQNLKEGSQSGFEKAARLAASFIKTRGLVILFSDLLTRPEEIEKTLKHYLSNGNEVIVFQILSQEELGFPFKKFGVFEDMETERRLLIQPTMVKDEYINQMKDYLLDIRKTCLKLRVTYQLLETTTPFDKALTTFIKTRSKMN